MNTKSPVTASHFDWFSGLLKALLIAITIPAAAAGFLFALVVAPALVVVLSGRAALSAVRVRRNQADFSYRAHFSGPTHTY
ncbi:MAG: hypothetical protein AB3X41_10485 [Leptothrix ochracea]|jgi:hypothetical protein|uniref:hypothetical protein n=1 Tax=Leptothrix ochracea TaxID=735331 RepID=UPI0034E23E47